MDPPDFGDVPEDLDALPDTPLQLLRVYPRIPVQGVDQKVAVEVRDVLGVLDVVGKYVQVEVCFAVRCGELLVEPGKIFGVTLERFLGPFALGDIGEHGKRPGKPSVPIFPCSGGDEEAPDASVTVPEAALVSTVKALLSCCHAAPVYVEVPCNHEIGQRPAEHLPGRVAEHAGHRTVDVGGRVGAVDLQDPLVCRLYDRAELLLARSQGFTRLPPLVRFGNQHRKKGLLFTEDEIGSSCGEQGGEDDGMEVRVCERDLGVEVILEILVYAHQDECEHSHPCESEIEVGGL
ncbi:MAG: hypothetical protein BWX50_01708 [Euryarchaeota archaeon ADurb.Bin009]|nr:MAG: hypothetical protein BWX50_01708 [Euryarchaeota archaeon ADurb.Bin009]